MLSWLPEFLAFTRASGAPVDFLSSHLYPTDPQLPPSRDAFMEAVAAAAAVAGAAGLPLLLTEFNAGLGLPKNGGSFSLLDSSFAAAFLLHQQLLVQGVANLASMSWWTFTDFGFEEQGAEPEPWLPGRTKFGAMTRTGVPKPVYRGMQMLSEQAEAPGSEALPAAPDAAAQQPRAYLNTAGAVIGAAEGSVDLLVSCCGSRVTALLGNFNSSSAPVPARASVSITFSGLSEPLPTQALLQLLDSSHANPMAAWQAAGSPLYPSAQETAAELAASQLQTQTVQLAAGPSSGSVVAVLQLEAYAVARLQLDVQ
jgi:xylan 1,4-beta-xylosidase